MAFPNSLRRSARSVGFQWHLATIFSLLLPWVADADIVGISDNRRMAGEYIYWNYIEGTSDHESVDAVPNPAFSYFDVTTAHLGFQRSAIDALSIYGEGAGAYNNSSGPGGASWTTESDSLFDVTFMVDSPSAFDLQVWEVYSGAFRSLNLYQDGQLILQALAPSPGASTIPNEYAGLLSTSHTYRLRTVHDDWGADWKFRLDLTPVPEPSVSVLLFTGFVALASRRRLNRR